MIPIFVAVLEYNILSKNVKSYYLGNNRYHVEHKYYSRHFFQRDRLANRLTYIKHAIESYEDYAYLQRDAEAAHGALEGFFANGFSHPVCDSVLLLLKIIQEITRHLFFILIL